MVHSDFKILKLDKDKISDWLTFSENAENESKRLEEYFSNEERDLFLLGYLDNSCIGQIKLFFVHNKLFQFSKLKVKNGYSKTGTKAFTDYLYENCCQNNITILSSDKSQDTSFNLLLEGQGFIRDKSKAFVERDLKDYSSPYPHNFIFKSLAELDKQFFIKIMSQAAIGDPFEEVGENPEDDFNELIEGAGNKFKPELWKIAYLNNQPIGVFLPQEFADIAQAGTLFYIGVIPEFRGKGFGKILHAEGLSILANNNIHTYKGSTDIANKPMLKIFEQNNCNLKLTQYFYKPEK